MVSDAGAGDSVTRVANGARALLPALAGPQAVLRDDQLAAIQALVVDRRRAVVVKRTGWGKSAVYFLATRLLRDDGAGPTCWSRQANEANNTASGICIG